MDDHTMWICKDCLFAQHKTPEKTRVTVYDDRAFNTGGSSLYRNDYCCPNCKEPHKWKRHSSFIIVREEDILLNNTEDIMEALRDVALLGFAANRKRAKLLERSREAKVRLKMIIDELDW